MSAILLYSIRISYVPSTRTSYTFRVYVTAKVTYSAENAKHLSLSGAVAVSNYGKIKFFSNSGRRGFKTLYVVGWENFDAGAANMQALR